MAMSTIDREKARFDTRLSKEHKELFEKAARIGGFSSLSEFVINTVKKRALKIVQEQEQIIASEKDREIFFNALTHPPKPNKQLRDAAKEYQSKVE